MENAAEALKMGFAVMVFVIALTVVFSMVSQAKQTADVVFEIEDDTKYFQEGLEGVTYLTSGATERIVGWETVVPTIYRYNVENYGVTIIDNTNGETELNIIKARFDYNTETVVQNWTSNNKTYKDDSESNPNEQLIKYLNKKVYANYLSFSEPNNEKYTELFERIYNATSYSTANNKLGAPWLSSNTKDLKERLRVDLQNKLDPEKISFAKSGDGSYTAEYTGLNLGKDYSLKKFKESIHIIEETAPNGEVKQKVEIIYEVLE